MSYIKISNLKMSYVKILNVKMSKYQILNIKISGKATRVRLNLGEKKGIADYCKSRPRPSNTDVAKVVIKYDMYNAPDNLEKFHKDLLQDYKNYTETGAWESS